MDISDLNPHIRYAKLHRTAIPMRTEPSICYDCRLFYFNNISGILFTGKQKYKITNNTAIFLPPETEYKLILNFEKNCSMVVLNFDLTTKNKHIISPLGTAAKSKFDKTRVPDYNICKELSSPTIKNIPHIQSTLIKCTDNFMLKNDFYREKSSALLKLCILELIKNDSQVSYSDLCNNVLKYICDNFSNPSLTNEDIASGFNYHPYHLSNIIKKETGKTLHQFLIYYRLQNAKDLLTTTEHDIAHIAWKSGFSSPAHFTQIFRQNTQMTPKEYRKQRSGNNI